MIALQYALALVELDAEAHEDRARALFAAAAALPARDVFETRALAQGARIARVLDQQGARRCPPGRAIAALANVATKIRLKHRLST